MHPRTVWLTLALGACTPREACDPASCGLNAGSSRPVDEATWRAFGPLLDAYRTGPQPIEATALGMCLDAACTLARPPLAGVLPPGVWRLRGEFLLPELGQETWHFELHELCEVDSYEGAKKTGSRDETQVLTLDVAASPGKRAGNAAWVTRPSPDPVGDRICGWRMTAAAGPRQFAWEGVYQIPGVGRPIPAAWGPDVPSAEIAEAPPSQPPTPSQNEASSDPEDLGVLRVTDGKPEDAPRAPTSILPSAPEAAANPTPTTVKTTKPPAQPVGGSPPASPAQGTP